MGTEVNGDEDAGDEDDGDKDDGEEDDGDGDQDDGNGRRRQVKTLAMGDCGTVTGIPPATMNRRFRRPASLCLPHILLLPRIIDWDWTICNLSISYGFGVPKGQMAGNLIPNVRPSCKHPWVGGWEIICEQLVSLVRSECVASILCVSNPRPCAL